MTLPQRLLAAAILLATASPVTAQGGATGTATFQMKVRMPESVQAVMPQGENISMHMILMTDGHRIAMEILSDIGQSATGATHVRMIFSAAGDSVHVGIFLPPEAAAAMGGASGMRMDLPISMVGASNPLFGHMMDSIGKSMTDSAGKPVQKPSYRSLGTSATVAGIRCEEWEIVGMGDTTRTCVIATPPALVALQQRLKTMSGMQGVIAQIPGMADMEKAAYGGRQMTAIRTETVKTGLHLELTSFTAAAPDAALFELPSDMQVMPMPGKPGGGAPQL